MTIEANAPAAETPAAAATPGEAVARALLSESAGRFRMLPGSETPAAEAGAVDPAVAETPKPTEPADDKVASLHRRIADMERASRRQAQERKAERVEFARLQDLERRSKEDPMSVVNYDELTKQVLKGGEKPKPEEQALSKVELLEKRLAESEAKASAKEAEFFESQAVQEVNAAIAAREDLAFTAWLGNGPALLQKMKAHAAEFGECTDEDQERIAKQMESESQKLVSSQLRAGVKKAPALRALVLELAKELQPREVKPQPDQRASQGREAAAIPRAATTISSAASGNVERRAPTRLSDTDKRARALAALQGQK